VSRKLGRGLDSLIPVGEEAIPADRSVKITQVRTNPNQPRRHFDPESLEELAASIKEHGIIQPLIVTEPTPGSYELIAGERRLQAALLAGLGEVPIVVRDASEQQKLEVAIIENVQRRDLSPLEEARAYKRLIDEFNLTQEDVAARVGKNRVTVANTIRLLQLSPEIQESVEKGELTEGHARAILGSPPENWEELHRRVLARKLSVRDVERLAKERRDGASPAESSTAERLSEVETLLRDRLGSKVTVQHRGSRGQIKIEYYSKEELERLLESIGVELPGA
jgi:ParB family transcriptional regulator, chromosome partitioning protein